MTRMSRRDRPALLRGAAVGALAVLTLTTAACGGQNKSASSDAPAACTGGEAKAITIAYQPGLGYANLRMIKADKALEKELPGVAINWKELNSGAAIRDGVIANEIQVSSGGLGPFIIGRGAGVKWKTITVLNQMGLNLMAMKPEIQSVKDLQGKGKIAMPGPDSIQSVVLRKAAKEQLGNAKALDSQILAMGHPDGVQALVAGQVDAHLTSPPFQDQEKQKGAHVVLKSYDVFGPHTFNAVYATSEFTACNPKFSPALIKSLKAANDEINNNTDQAAAKLATEMGLSADSIKPQLKGEGTQFTVTPKGFEDFAKFMKESGLVRTDMTKADMFFDNEATQGGS